jgi:hypothetical protein
MPNCEFSDALTPSLKSGYLQIGMTRMIATLRLTCQTQLHYGGIDRNSARNYKKLQSTKYKLGSKRAKVQWAFTKLQKSNFRGDVTVLSNCFLKIHFFLVMQGIMKSYECHLNCPIRLLSTTLDYGRNANPNFEQSSVVGVLSQSLCSN